MGADANTAEQNPPDTTPENVEALLEAARYDDIDDLKNLASTGISLDSKDSQGRTALHMASANGNLEIVNYLISNRVFEALLCERKFLKASVLPGSLLFEQKDVNASNVENNTSLHWACLNGHIEVVKSLILAGADVSILNGHERTPMDEAVSGGKMDVIDAINTAVTQVELTRTSVS